MTDFSTCKSDLKHLAEKFGYLTMLKKLIMCGCESLDSPPFGLGKLIVLVELNLSPCERVNYLPNISIHLRCLIKLNMCGCESLEEYPNGLGELIALEELGFSTCKNVKARSHVIHQMEPFRGLVLTMTNLACGPKLLSFGNYTTLEMGYHGSCNVAIASW
jgi:hypothetical protein